MDKVKVEVKVRLLQVRLKLKLNKNKSKGNPNLMSKSEDISKPLQADSLVEKASANTKKVPNEH